jgi:hypothetical protein
MKREVAGRQFRELLLPRRHPNPPQLCMSKINSLNDTPFSISLLFTGEHPASINGATRYSTEPLTWTWHSSSPETAAERPSRSAQVNRSEGVRRTDGRNGRHIYTCSVVLEAGPVYQKIQPKQGAESRQIYQDPVCAHMVWLGITPDTRQEQAGHS